MKELAIDHTILFVNSPYTFKDVVDGLRKKKEVELKRAFGLKSRINKLTLPNGATVNILTPPVAFSVNFLPEGWIYQAMIKFNGWLLRLTASRALRQLNMNDRLINFVAFNQAMGVTTGRKFNEYSLIYHCYDEIHGAHFWLRKHGIALENHLLKMVDGTIVTSQGLYNSKKDLCKVCYVVKNAVNIDLFSLGYEADVHTQKVVGYIGSVDERLDYPLLVHLLESMPDTQFVFVGRITTDFGEEAVLRKYPNAILTGAKTPDELPGLLKTFSAGIIPFVKSDFTKGIYPMKINEYLAAGLPVISTDFSNLDDFIGTIQIALNKEIFLKDLQQELATDSTEKKRSRFKIAQQNTWTIRAGELMAAIEQIEEQKYG
jgi:glycosyltransferase involved in cell wall biosynthesis